MNPFISIVSSSRARGNRQGYLLALGSGQLALLATGATQLLTVPMQIHAVGIEGYGVVTLAVTWLGFAGIGSAWLTSGGVRRLGETAARAQWFEYSSTRRAVRAGLASYGMLLAVVTGLLAWSMREDLPFQFQAQWKEAILWLALTAFLQYEQAGLISVLTAAKRQIWCNLAMIVHNTLFLAMFWWLVVQRGGGMPAIFASLAAGYLASRITLSAGCKRMQGDGRGKGSLRAGFEGLITRRGAGYTVLGVLTLLQNVDVMLLGLLGGAEVVGLFSVLWRIPSLIVQVFWRIPAYLEPYVIEADAAGRNEQVGVLYRKGEKLYYASALGTGLAYAIGGAPLLELWLGAANVPHGAIGFWLAGGAAFWLAAVRWPINFLHALARLRLLVKTLLVENVLKTGVVILAFPWLGYQAPLLAINIAVGSWTFWGYRRHLQWR